MILLLVVFFIFVVAGCGSSIFVTACGLDRGAIKGDAFDSPLRRLPIFRIF
jgi:hypothetical protein